MSTAIKIFALIFPIFSLIGLGYFGKKRGLLKEDAADSLSAYVFYFAFPALLFSITAKTPVSEYTDRNLIIAYSLAMILLALIAAVLTRKSDGKTRGILTLTVIFGNVAYMGIPWNTLAFGGKSQSITALTIALTLSLTTFWSLFLGQSTMFSGTARGADLMRLPGTILLKLLRNPMIMAIVTGLTVSALKIEMPQAINGLLKLLAETAGPTALFALGAFCVGKKFGKERGMLSALIATKLVALPLLTFLMFKIFPVDPLKMSIAITQAAMPMAATNFVFAKQWDTKPELVGGAIVASTLFSMITLPILSLLLA